MCLVPSKRLLTHSVEPRHIDSESITYPSFTPLMTTAQSNYICIAMYSSKTWVDWKWFSGSGFALSEASFEHLQAEVVKLHSVFREHRELRLLYKLVPVADSEDLSHRATFHKRDCLRRVEKSVEKSICLLATTFVK